MTIAGTLEIQMLANLARLQKDMQDAKATVSKTVSDVNRMLGSIGVGISFAGVAAGFAAMMRASEEAAISQRKLDAIIRATGNTSGYTADQLSRLADVLARTSSFDDEAFREATATLLRFGNIGGENLEKVLKLSADYAALTGGDLVSAAEKMGRALSNPAEGLSKLERHFGSLAPEVEAAIKQQAKMGDSSGALSLAIEALQKKIGGADEGMNAGLTGAIKQLRKAISELMETLGAIFANQAVLATINAVSAALRGMKSVLEGDWVLKLAAVAAVFSGGGVKFMQALGNMSPGTITPSGGGGGPVDLGIVDEGLDSRGAANARIVLERIEAQKKAREEWLKNEERLRQLDAAGWVKYIDTMEKEDQDALLAMAKHTEDYYDTKDELRRMDEEGQLWLSKNVVKIVEEEERQIEALRQASFANFWNEVSDLAANFFTDLVMNGRDAFDNLRHWVKQLLADMVALFAKRWVLNLAAGGTMLGSAGSAMAGGLGTVGDGSIAGSLLGGLGSILPGGSIGTAFGNVANMGASLMGAGGSLSSTIGSVASFLPGIGAAIGVAAMIYHAFGDGPENPNFRWMQGTGGQGLFGGISTQGNYNFDSSGLTGYIGALDARLARILGPEGTAAATSGLAAYTQAGLRMDGSQPAQFAFPEGTDREAAEQLAKEVLQSRYGIIFDQIDKTIADTIKGWSGTSTELQTYIETALGVVEGLSGLGIRGLDVTTLQLMSAEGEELGATFTRVAGQWGQFNQLFTTEAEQLAAAQDLVTTTFADLGIAIPASKDEFEALVRGLDLSTESGRRLFTALMDVAPAFAAVEDAAASAMQSFYQIMGELRGPAYTTSVTQGLLQGAVQSFMAGNAWTTGMSWQEVASAFSTITADDFASYSTANQQLILEILGYQSTLNQAASQTQTYTTAVTGATGAVSGLADAIAQAKLGIRDWLDRIFLSDASPLTPSERLAFAESAYAVNLAKAQAGDVGALGSFTQFADAYLREAQSYWASSPEYRAIFEAVTGTAGGLAGLEDARPPTRGDAREDTDRIVRALEGVQTEIRDLGDGTIALNRATEQVRDSVDLLNRTQTRVVQEQTRVLATDLGV